MPGVRLLQERPRSDDIIFVWRGGRIAREQFWHACAIGRTITSSSRAARPTASSPTTSPQEDYLILESAHPVRIPARYLHAEGADPHGSALQRAGLSTARPNSRPDEERGRVRPILLKDRSRLTRVVLASHPFDVVQWDGYLYPFTFNANDFEAAHRARSICLRRSTRRSRSGATWSCTFAPRWLDHHPEAIKVPWATIIPRRTKSSFTFAGNSARARASSPARSRSWPQGIPHGPHPGTTLKSLEAQRTEELAVMFDTQYPLQLTEEALALDDPELSSQLARLTRGRRKAPPEPV